MNATTIEINLELELDGETVSGRASTGAGRSREFAGRIGLMGVIDHLLDEARESASADRSEKETTDVDR